MGKCVAVVDSYNKKCGNETPFDYKYCEKHEDRPKAIQERLKREVHTLSDGVISIVKDDVAGQPEGKLLEEQEELTSSSLVEKVTTVINNVLSFQEASFEKLMAMDGDWRYKDKAGAEQVRGEVQIYERALDRSVRALTAVTKLGIDAQLASASKSQLEAIKAALMKTLMRLGLSQEQIKQAKEIMAEEFEHIAKAG